MGFRIVLLFGSPFLFWTCYNKIKIIYKNEMKQKEIVLWTISGLALILSIFAIFGSRINGLQTFAAKSRLTASQQLVGGINGTPTLGGTLSTSGQGPATCEAMLESMTFSGASDWNVARENFLSLARGNCGTQFCALLDSSTAYQIRAFEQNTNGVEGQALEEWRDWIELLVDTYNSGCGGGGGGGTTNPNDPNSHTYSGSGGDTCTSSSPAVHTYLECVEASLRL